MRLGGGGGIGAAGLQRAEGVAGIKGIDTTFMIDKGWMEVVGLVFEASESKRAAVDDIAFVANPLHTPAI